MLTDFIIFCINFLDSILSGMSFFDKLQSLITTLNTYQTYINDFQYYLSGAYFIFGKPLIIFVVGLSATVFAVKLIGAIVMIVGQFIP